jgi:hypothetical protein
MYNFRSCVCNRIKDCSLLAKDATLFTRGVSAMRGALYASTRNELSQETCFQDDLSCILAFTMLHTAQIFACMCWSASTCQDVCVHRQSTRRPAHRSEHATPPRTPRHHTGTNHAPVFARRMRVPGTEHASRFCLHVCACAHGSAVGPCAPVLGMLLLLLLERETEGGRSSDGRVRVNTDCVRIHCVYAHTRLLCEDDDEVTCRRAQRRSTCLCSLHNQKFCGGCLAHDAVNVHFGSAACKMWGRTVTYDPPVMKMNI